MLTIKSPGYFPETQYFFEIFLSTHFILADHLIFPKRSSVTRTSIHGFFLTIPTSHSGGSATISERKISYNENWQSKHTKFLYHYYHSFTYFESYFHQIDEIINTRFIYLIDLLDTLFDFLARNLQLNSKTFKSSELGFTNAHEYSLCKFAKSMNLNTFFSFENKNFLKSEIFLENEIRFLQLEKSDCKFLNRNILDNLFEFGPETTFKIYNLINQFKLP